MKRLPSNGNDALLRAAAEQAIEAIAKRLTKVEETALQVTSPEMRGQLIETVETYRRIISEIQSNKGKARSSMSAEFLDDMQVGLPGLEHSAAIAAYGLESEQAVLAGKRYDAAMEWMHEQEHMRAQQD